ncbi:MAG: DEAD/DEAH box helicase [Candidatus Hodarchaeota archaeon]
MKVGEVATKETISPESEYLVHPLLKDKAVEGRTYQALILSNIVKHNSLVVAPTGTGKTVLFLLATVHALQNSTGFTIILAPTLALIEQHVNFFREKTIFKPSEILSVTGKTDPKRRKQLWNGNTFIFVSTPETLLNDLQVGFVDLKQCQLMVIDEAHRGAQEKYQRIMDFVRDAREKDSSIRILAASATIPEAKLFEIMTSLDIEHVEVKTAKDQDLSPYIVDAQVDQIIVPLPEPWHRVMDELLSLRAAALKRVNRYQDIIGIEIQETASRSTLLTALDRLTKLSPSEGNHDIRTNLSSRLAAAIKLDHALDLFSRQGKTAFLDFVQKLYKKSTKANKRLVNSPQLQMAIEIATALPYEHPKVRELLRILEAEPARTVMIFSRSKINVFQIAKILQEQGIRTSVLVGKRDLSEEKRKKVLEDFQTGELRVLVSTNVGEEGLDVGCDLVIFYDSTASVIRRIQRKGRLRKHGKIIFLIAKDTLDEVFHWISTGEERKMQDAFERLKNHPEVEFPQQPPCEENQQKSLQDQKPMTTANRKRLKTEILVKIDTREAPSFSKLWFGEKSPKIAGLGGPSFVIDDVAIFRFEFLKLLQELAGGTLLPKLLHAAKQFNKSIIILEGALSRDMLKHVKIHTKAILKTLWSIVLELGISMIPSASLNETKQLLRILVEHQQMTKKPIDLEKHQENLIACLPGVSNLLAKRLLANFRTPLKVFSLSEEELQTTHGIGQEKSRKIFMLLNSSYATPD